MAIFKITGYRRPSRPNAAEIDILILDGSLAVDDTFCCYDTHHPVKYVIETSTKTSTGMNLLCNGFYCYDDAFVGAIIDTSKAGRPEGFHYEATPNEAEQGAAANP